jgi:hypothetical protein
MLQYTMHLHDQTGWNVYPIALLSYSRPNRELIEHFDIICAGFHSLHFRYRLVQLNRMNWRDYARTPNPVAAALMSRMGIEQVDRPLVKLACLRLLAKDLTVEQIRQATTLPAERIQQLRARRATKSLRD